MDETRITVGCDAIHAAKLRELRQLNDRYWHELRDDGERQELRDRILRLRARLGVATG